MGRRVHADIEIRGQVFPTAQAAARHFGVSATTVQMAARRGTLHRVGTGAVGAEPCPVRVRGTVYPSARAAASALGLTPAAIFQALRENRIDTVGTGARCPIPFRSRPITLGGLRFPSLAAADRALGFAPGYIAHSLKLGRRCAMERIMAAAMAHAAGAERRAA